VTNGKMQNQWPKRKNNYGRTMLSRENDKREAAKEVAEETAEDEG
jgi:hypothetical protein